MTAAIRQFDTGATRDLDVSKLDYEGFLSPLVLKRFAEYMHANRVMVDGSLRDSDNWQKGIPPTAYMKSGFRHFFDWWSEHRGIETPEGIELAICGLLFNAAGYLHETLKAKDEPHPNTLPDPSYVHHEAVMAEHEEPIAAELAAAKALRERAESQDDDDMGLKAGEAA